MKSSSASTRCRGLAAIALAISLTSGLSQSSWNWNGSVSGNWSDSGGANWTLNSAGGSSLPQGYLNFPSGPSQLLTTNDYAAYSSAFQIYFNSGASSYTLSGNPIKFYDWGGTAAAIQNDSANTQTINFLFGAGNSVGININPNAGDLVITGSTALFLDGPSQIRVNGNSGRIATFNVGIGDGTPAGGSFALNGPATAIFNGANTYTGDTFINNGTLQFNSSGSLASGTIQLGDTANANNATLTLAPVTGGFSVGRPVVVRSGNSGVMTISSFNTSGTNLLSGGLTLNKALTVTNASGGTLAFSGSTTLAGNQLTVVGAGETRFSGTTTASAVTSPGIVMNGSGKLTIATAGDNTSLQVTANSGTVELGGTTANQTALVNVNGGTVRLTGTGTDQQIWNSGTLNISGGTFDQNGKTETVGTLRLTNGVITGSGTLTVSAAAIDAQAGSSATVLAGTVGLTKTTAGTVTLSGANTYSGPTTISAGTLNISGSGSLGGGSYAGLITNNGALNYSSSASQTLSGIISGTGSLTNSGSGTLTLSGANTYSGATTISLGTVKLGNASALGLSSVITVGPGGTLDVAGFSTAAPVSVSGTGVSGVALYNSSTTAGGAVGSIKLDANASIGAATADSTKLFADSGALDLNGQTLTISGVGAISVIPRFITSGNITVNSGATLYLTGSSGPQTSVTGTITVNSGGILDTRDADNTAMTTLHTIALKGGTLGNGVIAGNNGGGLGAKLKNNITVDSINGGTLAAVSSGFALSLKLSGALSGSGPLSILNNGVEFQGDVSGYSGTATATGGTVTFNGSADQIFNGILAGTRPMAKNGSKILTLTGANTYSGATTVGAGELIGVTGGSCANSAVTVSNGATNGVQVLTTGGQWTCANLTCAASSADMTFMDFNYGATTPSTTTAPLQVNGNVALNARVGVIVRGSAFVATGTYPLIKYTGTLSGTVPTAVWSLPSGMVATLVNNTSAKTIDLVVTSVTGLASIWKVSSGIWDINTTGNWTNSAGATVNYLDGNSVVFNTPSASGTVTLNTTVTPAAINGGVTFNNSGFNYTVSGSGAIAGAVGLTKSGSGELVLATTNTFSGGTLLNGGILRASATDSALGSGSVTVVGSSTLATASGGGARTLANALFVNSGQTLSLDAGFANLTLSGGISGAGAVTKTSTGTLTFSTQKTYTGGTTVNGGTLDLTGGGGSSGTIRGTVTVNTGATLQLSTGDATGFGGGSSSLSPINLTGGTLNVNTTANQTLGSAVVNMTGGSITGVGGGNLDFFGGASALNTIASSTASTISGVQISPLRQGSTIFTVAAGTTLGGVDLDISSVLKPNGDPATAVLFKAGAGTMRLSANNTLARPITIIAGKLIGATSGSCSNSILSISNSATLGVQVLTNGGQWSCAGLTNSATGTAEFNFYSAAPSTTIAPLQILGNLINNGTLNVSVVGNVIPVGTYPLVKYTGSLTVGTLGTVSLPGGAATLVNNTANKTIDLNVTIPNQIVWQGGTGTWNINTTANWTNNNGTAVNYLDGSAVILNDSSPGVSPLTVTLAASVSPANVVVTNPTKDYKIAGGFAINGATSLTKSGAGTLTLANTVADTYSGGTTVSGGTLALGTGGTGANTSTANALGTGPVVVNGGGTVKFWIQNSTTFTITNPFTINGGTLLGQDGNYRLTGGVVVGSAGAMFQDVFGGKDLFFDGVISGTGPITNSGDVIFFTAANTYTGPTIISSGTLKLTNSGTLGSGSYAANITNNGNFTYNSSVAQTLSGIISGTGSLTQQGSGTLTLNGNNTYSGGTTVNGGTLQVGHKSATTGKATLNGGNLTIANGVTYNIDGGITFASNTGASVAATSGTAFIQGFDVNSADVIVNTGINGSISSSVGADTGTFGIRFDVNGTATLQLDGAIGGTGNVGGGVVNNGTLVGTDKTALFKRGTGDLTLTGASTFTAGANVAATSLQEGRLILSGGNNRLPAAAAIYLGNANNTSGKLVLAGVSQAFTGLATIGTGTTNAVVGGSVAAATMSVNNANNYTYNGAIGGVGANENNLNFVKSGVGQLLLPGNLTYTGNTTISAGTVSASSLTNADGATLSVVDVAGTLSATNLTLGTSAGSTVAITGFASATSAPIIATNLTVNGVTTITLTGVFTSGQYPLIQYVSGTIGGTGSFTVQQSNLPRGVAATIVTNGANKTIDVVLTANALVWVGSTNGVNVATWDNGATTNWSLIGTPNYFTNGDNVLIDDTAVGSTTLNLATTLSPFAVLITNSTKDFTISATGPSALTGGMSLIKRGSRLLTITESNSFTGGVTIGGGAVNIQNGYAFNTNNVTIASGAELQLQGGIIVPAVTVQTLSGTGTNTTGGLRSISGNNTNAGPITLGAAARINSDSGTLTLTGGVTAGANPVSLGGSGNIVIATAGISGSAGLVKDGSGTNIWSVNPNISSGGVTVNGGTLQINNGNFGGTFTPLITVNPNATLWGNGTHSSGGGAALVLNQATWLMSAEDYKQSLTMTDSLIAQGPNPVSSGGELRVGSSGGAGSWTWYVTNSVTGSVINTKLNTIAANVNLTLNVARGAAESDLTINGAIINGGNITFAGDGVTTLAGNNSYSGTTVVSAGTLRVNGTNSGSGSLTVDSGAMLTGSGTINGTVTNNGTIAPGITIGTLSLSNAPVLGGLIVAEINQTNAQTADLLRVANGTLGYGGTLTVTNLGPALANGTFTLFNAASYAGAFASFNLPPGGLAHWKTNNLVVDGTISFTNYSPVAQNLTVGVAHGGTVVLPVIGGKNSATDADGDAIVVTAVGTPTSGSVSFGPSNVTYVASGTAGTNSFTYTVTDVLGSSDTKTVTVLVADAQGFNLLSATSGGGNAYLSYLGIPGTNYALEVTHALPPTNWTAVASNVADGSGRLYFTNSISLSPTNDYYRTRYVP